MSISLMALLILIYLAIVVVAAVIWWSQLCGPGLEGVMPADAPAAETTDDFTLAMRANQDRMERMGR